MGKKVKKKGSRSVHKEKQVVTTSQKSSPQHSTPSIGTTDLTPAVTERRKICPHLDHGFDLAKVASKIGSSVALKCEDCREASADRRAGKGKGKHGKKKGGGSGDSKSVDKAIWVCLECGHFSCGGAGFPTTPQSHAVRHAKQNGHLFAIQFKNPLLRWCFRCNTLIPVSNSEDSGQPKDLLSDIVQVIKARPSEETLIDVEDVWFGSGSVKSEMNLENITLNNLEMYGGYVVRGLINLGNTCFFNSIMQNLLAIDKLRDHFLKMDGSIGPLTVSLKKLFVETSPDSGLSVVINPKPFFGCVCDKAPQFRGYLQHDSHELLRCLLDGLCTEEMNSRKQSKSSKEEVTTPSLTPTFVDAIFGGKLSSTVSCLECTHSSVVYEPFLDLSLPIPTKKSLSKQVLPVTRSKKPKLPPRRSQRIRSKVNRSADPEASHCIRGSSTSDHKSFQTPRNASIAENTIPSSVDSTLLEPVDQIVLVNDNVLSSQNPSCTQGFDTGETVVSVDDTSWLDYLETDMVLTNNEMAAQSYCTSLTKEPNDEDTLSNDVLSQNALEISRQDPSHSVEQMAPLSNNFIEQTSLSDGPDITSEINDISGVQDSVVKESAPYVAFSGHSSEYGNQIVPKDSDGMDYVGNSWEDELPLQVQSSEVLLLPYKEDVTGKTSNKEDGVPMSAVGCEQDISDFGGFGDLFDEPAGPILKPPSDNLSGSNEVAENSITFGLSSGSDPDEIDNSDSPVSVERCLAYFTKPELLSKNEHAWHCENCSKVVLEQRKSRKRLQKSMSKVSLNRGGDEIGDDQSGSGNDFSLTNVSINLGNANNKSDVPVSSSEKYVSRNGNINGDQDCTCGGNQINEQPPVASPLDKEKSEIDGAPHKLTCSQGNYNDFSTVNNSGTAGCNTNSVQQREFQHLAEECESEESEEEELDSKGVKVTRDATKRILIDSAPPVLTIHLKRFSQDARGRISKLNGHVYFRDTVDLKPYMHPRCTEREKYNYRLVGVVEHLGTMRGGHYVAYVRGGPKSTGKAEKESADFVWFHASDAYVREVSFEEVLRCEAYILFYEEI